MYLAGYLKNKLIAISSPDDVYTTSTVTVFSVSGSKTLQAYLPDTPISTYSGLLLGAGVSERYLDRKVYELTDHLGNVRAVVSDAKNVSLSAGNPVDFTPIMEAGNNYYAFGMQMPGRSFNSDAYRYGFNGMEKDDEVKGSGNSVNYKYRMHDPRIGRFLSLDPLSRDYPWNSPYAFSENRVTNAIEIEGLEAFDLNGGINVYGPYANQSEAAQAAIEGSARLNVTLPEIEVVDFQIVEMSTGDNMGIFRSGRGEINDFALDFLNSSIIGVLDNSIATFMSDDATTADKAWASFDAASATITTTRGGGRRAAFRNAKRQLNIPMSEQPRNVIKPNTPEGNAVKPIPLDSRNRRLYEFRGDKVIREDFPYSKTGQKQHFNFGSKNQKLKSHSPEGSNKAGEGFDHKP